MKQSMSRKTKPVTRSKDKTSMQGKQGRKDSKSKRVNLDNERVSKYDETHLHEKDIPGKINDVSWYAHNMELLKSAASIPFSTTTGQKIPNMVNSVPGSMAIMFTPYVGGTSSNAINAAKDEMYSFVVHANSRNYQYSSADLMCMVLAGSNFYMMLANGIRAYGLMRTYDQRNKYLPAGLIKQMGFNFNNLRANLSQMWFDLNEVIARASQIWIPNTMPVLTRWFWMCSNIYQDSTNVKGQFYMFVPNYYYYFNATTYTTGSCLKVSSKTVWNPGTIECTWSNYKSILNQMLDALILNEDRGMIFGDILNAYGADKIYAISPITSDYSVIPVYVEEVLTQIENASIQSWAPGDILQNENFDLMQTGPFSSYASGGSPTWVQGYHQVPLSRHVLNFHKMDVTPEDVMVATRLMSSGTTSFTLPGTIYNASDVNTYEFLMPKAAGTEVVTGATYTNFTTPEQIIPNVVPMKLLYKANEIDISMAEAMARQAFDWSPWTYHISGEKANPTVSDYDASNFDWAIGDWDNYTLIDSTVLEKMHNTAIYSEFGVPVL